MRLPKLPFSLRLTMQVRVEPPEWLVPLAVFLVDIGREDCLPTLRENGVMGWSKWRLGEAIAGLHGLISLHLKAWGGPPHS